MSHDLAIFGHYEKVKKYIVFDSVVVFNCSSTWQ